MTTSPNGVVLVTGASSGLGQAMARHFRQRGLRVYGTSRQPRGSHDVAWPMLQLDVRSDASVQACVDDVRGAEGRIDVLINNAGYAFVGAVEETSVADTRDQMETNFFGVMRMMKAVLPVMRDQGAGRIVNISSLAGIVGAPFLGAYAASKHALEGISEALAHELRGTRIHVTLVEPDGMRTGIGFHHPDSDSPLLATRRRRMLAMLQQATAEQGGGTDPDLLAHAVADSLESDRPPLRIVIGEAAQALITAWRTLPDAAFGDLLAARLEADPGATRT
nr:SDR family oxidoreductase [Reyranella sp. CPCC 100927]